MRLHRSNHTYALQRSIAIAYDKSATGSAPPSAANPCSPEVGNIPIVNGCAAGGSIDGWTNPSGNLATRESAGVLLPYVGTHFFYGAGGSVPGTSLQDIDLTQIISDFTEIDAGNVTATLTFQQSSYAGSDNGRVVLSYRGAAPTYPLLGTLNIGYFTAPTQVWTERTISGTVPPGTRNLRLSLYMYAQAGTNADAYIDAIKLNFDPLE